MRALGADQYLLDAARGWLDLDDFEAAAAELSEMSPGSRNHPEVLKIQWAILEGSGNWDEAYALGESLRQATPEEPFGWNAAALALHKAGRSSEAYELIGAFCPKNLSSELALTTARIACALGKISEARLALEFAFTLAADEQNLRRQAQLEPDLRQLWPAEERAL